MAVGRRVQKGLFCLKGIELWLVKDYLDEGERSQAGDKNFNCSVSLAPRMQAAGVAVEHYSHDFINYLIRLNTINFAMVNYFTSGATYCDFQNT